jgi:cytochrome c-type protein NapC
MDMWIEDANDPESTSLAAIHSRTHKFGGSSCYYCHKDYGMFGYAMTKLGGMGHVYMFLSEWMFYDRDEVIEKIHIARPFKNENCMQCHSTTGAIWSGTADHAGLLEDLRSGETSCVSAGCHGYAHPFSKPEGETPSHEEVHTAVHGNPGEGT